MASDPAPTDPGPDDTDDAKDDRVTEPPADIGHSDADTQSQRNIDDESPG